MVRKQIYITENQAKALRDMKIKHGIPEAEAVRRAIDEYTKRNMEARKGV